METVLITGASRGIGAAAARRFARAGWGVAVNYLSSEEKALSLCRELGENTFPVRGDVSDPEDAQKIASEALMRFGHLDALVCSAGIALPLMVAQDVTREQWERLLAVDVSGVFYCCQAAIPAMLRARYGRIVTLSSMWGQVGGSCEVAYSAAKGAVLSMTKALAQELAPSGITVNAVAPGVIDTDMMAFADEETRAALREQTPVGRLGTPEDVAESIFFLCQRETGFITGQVLGVNGGFVV